MLLAAQASVYAEELLATSQGTIQEFSQGSSLSSTIDCSQVDINYVDNPDLTDSERLEAMDNAFFESVNRFELCNLSNQANSSSTNASISPPPPTIGAEAATGGESGENSDGNYNQEGFESAASPLMTGTEEESSLPATFLPNGTGMPEDTSEEGDIKKTYAGTGLNGAIPEDIPDSNNDDVIAAQIRLAAEIETDPDKKAKLWNEYRKYKGLPVKKYTKETVKKTVEIPTNETTQNTVQFF